jgi:uncharacterized protein with GYD domain
MAHYLLQVAYAPEAVAAMIGNPQNRMEAVRSAIENLGGSVGEGWFTFGDYDLVTVCEFPDNASAAAFSMAVSAGGAVTALKTTPLMTMEEGMEAMRKARGTGYTPPSS